LLGITGSPAECDLAPRRDRMTALVLALAAAVRVVDGVHRGASHRRALAEPAGAPGLSAGLVLVHCVGDGADRCATRLRDPAKLAGGEAQQRATFLAGDQLRTRPGRAHHAGALARA